VILGQHRAHAQDHCTLDNLQAALDLVQGAVILGVRTMLTQRSLANTHVESIITMILRSLGVPKSRARALCEKSSNV